jgi:xylulokinase
LGAARLAWLADGGSVADVCLAPPVAQRFKPGNGNGANWRHERFRRLYSVLLPEFSPAAA